MIVQTAPDGAPHLVIQQSDHARLSGQFATAFGNNSFASLMPREPLLFVAAHHDEGWTAVDARLEQDVNTGLPYHLTQTPLPFLVETSAGSPAFNEAHHPYSGLLSSMHSYGLFNGRYGLSDKIFIELIPEQDKLPVKSMLRAELDRQERLLNALHKDDDLALWINEAHLFHNYKLLQFFDTLALYFQMDHPEARTSTEFLNVPQAVGKDVTIRIDPVDQETYTLAPYPFFEDIMTFHYVGRLMWPQPMGTDLHTLWEEIEPQQEFIRLIRV
ncbi:MAG: DUF3891 family protein [Candidatus Promineifilaceae bacterium]|nr:DUF3891 family protein [Candidatus Promineifilaceae bacterium]